MRKSPSYKCLLLVLLFVLSGCATTVKGSTFRDPPVSTMHPVTTVIPSVTSNATILPVPTIIHLPESVHITIDESVPGRVRDGIYVSGPAKLAGVTEPSDFTLDVIKPDSRVVEGMKALPWIYVLVAPFPTVSDQVSLVDLKSVWKGEGGKEEAPHAIYVSKSTRATFEKLWGSSSQTGVQVIDDDQMLAQSWADQPSWAIIPFEQLEPRWKVIKIDGVSPLDEQMNLKNYPLLVEYGLQSVNPDPNNSTLSLLPGLVTLPQSNYDPSKMTSLLLTGTTALVRALAERMETKSVDYPAENIVDWLRQADITHISNEVPFYSQCPPAVPLRREMRFCSSPKYFELLKYIHADVIELTGNHLLDWGPAAMQETLDLYHKNNLPFYGGGKNILEAEQPLLIENHGNRIALLGCNKMGPKEDWATVDTPGSAPCDLEKLKAEVAQLKSDGYLPVVTFQHFELDDYKPQSSQRIDFNAIARVGAVIVSGSQAHHPQSMTFSGDHFIHYGLGNLFFDQMSGDNRKAFLDWHVFYDGRYISTELLTVILEDSYQLRPMTSSERKELLQTVFDSAVWQRLR